MAQPVTDEELLEEFRLGRAEAFEELVERYRDRLFGFALSLGARDASEAEDLAAEAWAEALRCAASYAGRSSFRTWLFGLARNVCFSRLRRLRGPAWQSVDDGALSELPSSEPGHWERLERLEREELVRRALAELPVLQREALVLRDWEGLSYEEMAAVLGVPVGTVRSRLHNATAALAARLERLLGEGSHGM